MDNMLSSLKGKSYSFGYISEVYSPEFASGNIVYAGFDISVDKGFIAGLQTVINNSIKAPARLEIIAIEEGHIKAKCLAEIIPASEITLPKDYRLPQGKNLDIAKKEYATSLFLSQLPQALIVADRGYTLVKSSLRKSTKPTGEWRGNKIHCRHHKS